MAYLNTEKREALLNELRSLTFDQAKARLRRMDPDGRLAIYRNNQASDRWYTRYDLEGLGTRVTLVEKHGDVAGGRRMKSYYELIEVIVEPTADNQT
jgi:hypothetical protein